MTRFSEAEPGRLRRATGTPLLGGRLAWGSVTELARPASLPAFALERVLEHRADWLAYRGLGFGATADFQLGAGSSAIPAGEPLYWVAEMNPEAQFSDGKVINVATRVRSPPHLKGVRRYFLPPRPPAPSPARRALTPGLRFRRSRACPTAPHAPAYSSVS